MGASSLHPGGIHSLKPGGQTSQTLAMSFSCVEPVTGSPETRNRVRIFLKILTVSITSFPLKEKILFLRTQITET